MIQINLLSQEMLASVRRERVRAHQADWYKKNAERVHATRVAWIARNRERKREANRNWERRNPEKLKTKRQRVRNRVRHARYIAARNGHPWAPGQTDVAALLFEQTTCQCCGVAFEDGHKAVIDHCHATGRLRGRVCNGCNSMLGYAADDPQILVAGAKYLLRRSRR